MKTPGQEGGQVVRDGGKRSSHYQPRKKPSVGFRWWRAARYTVANGVICPVGRVEPFYVAPGDIRWAELAAWGRRGQGPLTAKDHRAIREWCQSFGLPGYLLATTATIALPSSTTPVSPYEEPEWETWQTYVRRGDTWVNESTELPWSEEENRPNSGGWVDRAPLPLPLESLIHVPEEYGTLTAPLAWLQPRLACPVAECPSPGAKAFWQVYQEPVADFLSAARVVGEVLDEYEGAKGNLTSTPLLAQLLQHNGWSVDPDGTPAWTGSSLLAALALSLVLKGKPLKACKAKCGGLVPPGRSDQEYCTTRCAERIRKREKRKRQGARKASRPPG